MMVHMTTQLRLIEPTDADWRLDERTKAIGRKGLAQARAALRAARTPGLADVDQATQLTLTSGQSHAA
jgi:hypothetical protein